MKKLDKLGKGIILMHDFQKHTAEALPELLRKLKAGGYKVVQMQRQGAGADPAAIRRRASEGRQAADRKLPAGLQRRADDFGIDRPRDDQCRRCASKAMSSSPPTACWRMPIDVMPDELKFEGDKQFFTAALDRADLIVHGRHSFEDQPNSPKRKRIILTRKIGAIAPDPSNPNATLWNPAGASFEAACERAGVAFRHRRDHRRARRVRDVHGPLRHVLAVAGAACAAAGRRTLLSRRAPALAAGNSGRARAEGRRAADARRRRTTSASRRGGGRLRAF